MTIVSTTFSREILRDHEQIEHVQPGAEDNGLLLCLFFQVTINVRTVFLKVGEIDTLRDRFAADAYVQAKWREPAMDGKQTLVLHFVNC